MQQRSDRELLADLAGSNPTTALGECLARYGQMVHRTARRITNDEHLAEDVCQAVFLVLLRKAATLLNVASLAAWLHRVAILAARNTVKLEMRRRKREEKAAMVHDLNREPAAKLPTGIDQAIDRLPEVFRRVIVAHYLEGRPYAEVASQLGVSEETARMRGSRALDRLRRSLAPTTAGITVVALSSALTGEAAAASALPLAASQAAAIQATVLGGASAQTSALAGAVMKAMFWAKMKLFGATVAMAALVAVPAAVMLKPADASLVGQYRFDEGAGTYVADASPSSNHGTLMGGVTWTAGPKPGSRALSFDGKTGYVQLSQNLNQWLGGTATLAFWINTQQVGSGYPPVCVTGVDIVATTNDVHWGFLDATGRIGIGAGDDLYLQGKITLEQMTARSAKPINDGQWHHVALTRDAALGRLQVYVDGALSSTTSTGVKGLKTTPFFSLGRKEVFPPRPDKPVLYFRGMLAEVALYNRVLSASEIEAVAR